MMISFLQDVSHFVKMGSIRASLIKKMQMN